MSRYTATPMGEDDDSSLVSVYVGVMLLEAAILGLLWLVGRVFS